MICYLNRGLILEQAICSLVHDYFDSLHLDNKYKNFHISVTTDHPFAELYLHSALNVSDTFPAVVITTQEDRKPEDLFNLAPETVYGISIDGDDLEEIIRTTETKEGVTRDIPGLCTVVDTDTLAAIRETIETHGQCSGLDIRIRRKDSMSVEIWAENIQLKNEIYEQLRLFIAGNLRHILSDKYPFFDILIEDGTVNGHRSNNFNFDFDVLLAGACITFDVSYCVEQLVLDTEASGTGRTLIVEVENHVKE